jgi:hypothetical protein
MTLEVFMKKYEVEPLNYTDVNRLIEAFTLYLGAKEGSVGTYNLELLCKLERNKRILYDEPHTPSDCASGN